MITLLCIIVFVLLAAVTGVTFLAITLLKAVEKYKQTCWELYQVLGDLLIGTGIYSDAAIEKVLNKASRAADGEFTATLLPWPRPDTPKFIYIEILGYINTEAVAVRTYKLQSEYLPHVKAYCGKYLRILELGASTVDFSKESIEEIHLNTLLKRYPYLTE